MFGKKEQPKQEAYHADDADMSDIHSAAWQQYYQDAMRRLSHTIEEYEKAHPREKCEGEWEPSLESEV